MTHFSDELRIGRVFDSKFLGSAPKTFVAERPIPDLGPGAVCSPMFIYSFVPLTLQTANVAASQTPGAAGNLTLTAGTGATAATIFGNAAVKADVPRALKVSCAGADSGRTFTVTGYDLYGQVQTEAIAGAATGSTNGKKTWLYITNIAVDAATAGAITVGFTDIFGLPYAVTDKTLLTVKWNNTLADDAATVVVADASAVTTTTGDVRGTVVQSSGASDGAKRMTCYIAILDPDTATGLYGVTPG